MLTGKQLEGLTRALAEAHLEDHKRGDCDCPTKEWCDRETATCQAILEKKELE